MQQIRSASSGGRVLATTFLVSLAACSSEGASERVAWTVARDTVGDTIIVRTTAGSVWGDARLVEEVRIGRFDGPDEYTFGQVAALATGHDGMLYVLDQQVPALRAYAPDGTYLRDLGRGGEGPGELKQVDAGLAVLDDGRVLVRDPGNARITVFGPEGEYETEWRIRGSSYTSTPLYIDRDENAYVQLFEFTDEGPQFWFVRYSRDGVPGDTIPVPRVDPAPQLIAEHRTEDGTNRSSTSVPFWPGRAAVLSRDGEFVFGNTGTYSIDVPRPGGGILRIQRAFEPVPVLPAERDNVRERLIHNMRQTEPGWRWSGPAIPLTKPAFQTFMVDADGRIWTRLYSEAERIPDEEIERPEPGTDEPPPLRWREPIRFDVFDTDGSYLGRLDAPNGFATYPQPAIEGDRVWAVVRDELDVSYVVGFRIVPQADRP